MADVDVVACAEAGALGGAGSADGTSVVFKGYRYAVLPGGPGIGPTGKKQSCKTDGPLPLGHWAVVETDAPGIQEIRQKVTPPLQLRIRPHGAVGPPLRTPQLPPPTATPSCLLLPRACCSHGPAAAPAALPPRKDPPPLPPLKPPTLPR